MNYFPDQVFLGLQEIVGEITLIIPLAGCSHHCVGCHSPHLQDKDGGEPLYNDTLYSLYDKYKNKASTICFFGGEHDTDWLIGATDVAHFCNFKTALYSGFDFEELPEGLADCFDFIKVGSYQEEFGALDAATTNQRMLRREADGSFIDITSEFWR